MTEPLFTVRDSWIHKKDGLTVTPGVSPELKDEIVGATLAIRQS